MDRRNFMAICTGGLLGSLLPKEEEWLHVDEGMLNYMVNHPAPPDTGFHSWEALHSLSRNDWLTQILDAKDDVTKMYVFINGRWVNARNVEFKEIDV